MMTRMTVQRLLLIAGAALVLYTPGLGQSTRKPHDPPPSNTPIELKEIKFEYGVPNQPGQLIWHKPNPKTNKIPANAQRLRFVAKVNNRPAGTTIRLKGFLHETCRSPDPPNKFLKRLRHLTESDPMEQHQIGPDGRVTIEIPVHCDACGQAVCRKKCDDDKNHLGEGPHEVTIRASDEPAPPADGTETKAATAATPTMPASFRTVIRTFCPKKKAS